jgi:UDP-N-acetylmuramoyl-tripeptide--D-alanyl-D-alanine ligase
MTADHTAGVDLLDAALRHRARLSNVVFVAVTGSCGKTTTKNLIASVLAGRRRGSKSSGSNNCGIDVVKDVLAVHRDDDFFVQELGAWGQGTLDAGINLIRPHIAVVTNLRNDHYSAFHGPRGAQAEKAKLVVSLPSAGTAVLNWDDQYVRELAGRTSARILSVGRNSQAQLRALDVTSNWPARLSFQAVHGRERVHVRTRLLGEHLLGSALSALEPTPRRMMPTAHPDGVTFIRDDFKATADSVPEVLAFMRQATAPRKVAVFGRISDFPGRSRRVYTEVAEQATAVLDTVVFVGDRAIDLWGKQHDTAETAQLQLRHRLGFTEIDRVHRARPPGDMFVFESVWRASRFLSSFLQVGDLVLLKGSGPADHLERIMLSRDEPVSCWLSRCGRVHCCDVCELLTTPLQQH